MRFFRFAEVYEWVHNIDSVQVQRKTNYKRLTDFGFAAELAASLVGGDVPFFLSEMNFARKRVVHS